MDHRRLSFHRRSSFHRRCQLPSLPCVLLTTYMAGTSHCYVIPTPLLLRLASLVASLVASPVTSLVASLVAPHTALLGRHNKRRPIRSIQHHELSNYSIVQLSLPRHSTLHTPHSTTTPCQPFPPPPILILTVEVAIRKEKPLLY